MDDGLRQQHATDSVTLRNLCAERDALRQRAERAEARVREAPVARPLELQCNGFDDPDRERLDAIVKSGKRVRLVVEE